MLLISETESELILKSKLLLPVDLLINVTQHKGNLYNSFAVINPTVRR